MFYTGGNWGIDLKWNQKCHIYVRFDVDTVGIFLDPIANRAYSNYMDTLTFIKLLKLNGVDYKKHLDKLSKV